MTSKDHEVRDHEVREAIWKEMLRQRSGADLRRAIRAEIVLQGHLTWLAETGLWDLVVFSNELADDDRVRDLFAYLDSLPGETQERITEGLTTPLSAAARELLMQRLIAAQERVRRTARPE
jgi:hypothetical protein